VRRITVSRDQSSLTKNPNAGLEQQQKQQPKQQQEKRRRNPRSRCRVRGIKVNYKGGSIHANGRHKAKP